MRIEKISNSIYTRFYDKEMEQFFEDFFGKKDGKEYYKTFSTKERKVFFAAKEGRKTVGGVSPRIGHKVAGIGAFVVAKEHRKSGIGSKLLEKCEAIAKKNKCKKIWLWTLPTIKAYGFYKKRGYVEEARLKKHFGGKDISVMSKFF
ncbi:GNAT family N-acetyltransferase [Candidatus Micrarchaeota archaeon]|nr:GNAT family N-acetyltransferase [Candidatus Micrarchaeota archaeon]MBU1681695.1 GNAT family N-acetyltransferase [Candidatus Micrarchaeota archaeon]